MINSKYRTDTDVKWIFDGNYLYKKIDGDFEAVKMLYKANGKQDLFNTIKQFSDHVEPKRTFKINSLFKPINIKGIYFQIVKWFIKIKNRNKITKDYLLSIGFCDTYRKGYYFHKTYILNGKNKDFCINHSDGLTYKHYQAGTGVLINNKNNLRKIYNKTTNDKLDKK